MIKLLLVLTLSGISVQTEDSIGDACNFEECGQRFPVHMEQQGVLLMVTSDVQKINITAISEKEDRVPLLLKVDEGKLFATIGECEGDHFYLDISSLQGQWAIKLDRDKIQVSYNGQMVIYYDFDEGDCSAMLKQSGDFTAFTFGGLTAPDQITVSPIVTGSNDCPYGHYPDTYKCMRDGSKCHDNGALLLCGTVLVGRCTL